MGGECRTRRRTSTVYGGMAGIEDGLHRLRALVGQLRGARRGVGAGRIAPEGFLLPAVPGAAIEPPVAARRFQHLRA